MGNLRELMTSVDILGMDKDELVKKSDETACSCCRALWQDKLHISGPAEADPLHE